MPSTVANFLSGTVFCKNHETCQWDHKVQDYHLVTTNAFANYLLHALLKLLTNSILEYAMILVRLLFIPRERESQLKSRGLSICFQYRFLQKATDSFSYDKFYV